MTTRAGVCFFVTLLSTIGPIQPAFSQANKKQQVAKINVQKKVAMFSGNESRINYLQNILMDCTSGPQPDIRVISKPKNGEVRFEQITVPIAQKQGTSRSHCNGKPLGVVGVYYKSKDGFVGEDQVTIDIDYKDGDVSRHVYVMDVR